MMDWEDGEGPTSALRARQGDKPAVYPSPSEGLFEPKP
ncbi:hypothetical protein SFOMI_0405 [Sphingobium fuliginis]|uniref:Uncharacterized protein n=1 Tax=Sphingobium fuliginis (strain ATCC 27551) TaxID=336203 RepID=A0A292ZAL3_SPHSA|nr:hypothetical protein SFOMI_0405 [Sphingobium fuliginis]